MVADQSSFGDRIFDLYFNRYWTSLLPEQRQAVDDDEYQRFILSLYPLMSSFASWKVPGVDRQFLFSVYSLRVFNDLAKNKVNRFRPRWNYYKPVFRTINYEIYRYYQKHVKKYGADILTKVADYPVENLATITGKDEPFYEETWLETQEMPEIISFIAQKNEQGDTSMNKIARLCILITEYDGDYQKIRQESR